MPVPHDTVSSTLPYATADGFLALRVRERPAHAEVTAIHIGAIGATATATLLGPEADTSLTGACVVAAPPGRDVRP